MIFFTNPILFDSLDGRWSLCAHVCVADAAVWLGSGPPPSEWAFVRKGKRLICIGG
jgi:hypothetical protein